MVTLGDSQLATWIAAWLWPFCRIAALLATAPLLMQNSLPRRVKIGLAALVAALAAPGLPMPTGVALLSGESLLIVAREILIGASLGFTMRLVFAAIMLAGDLMGLQAGLGFATLIDPSSRDQAPVLGSLLNVLGSLIFLAIDGHLMMLSLVVDSFHTLPLAPDLLHAVDWQAMARQGGLVFAFGLRLALPVLATLLLTNLALGILTRAAPQLNLFSVGFPLTVVMGLLALMLALPVMLPVMQRMLEDMLNLLV